MQNAPTAGKCVVTLARVSLFVNNGACVWGNASTLCKLLLCHFLLDASLVRPSEVSQVKDLHRLNKSVFKMRWGFQRPRKEIDARIPLTGSICLCLLDLISTGCGTLMLFSNPCHLSWDQCVEFKWHYWLTSCIRWFCFKPLKGKHLHVRQRPPKMQIDSRALPDMLRCLSLFYGQTFLMLAQIIHLERKVKLSRSSWRLVSTQPPVSNRPWCTWETLITCNGG